jgi:hypothetical protein
MAESPCLLRSIATDLRGFPQIRIQSNPIRSNP